MIKIKTKEDIKILRETGKLHARIMNKLVKAVVPGLSTDKIDALTAKFIKEEPGVDVGDKSAILNYKPSGAKRPFPANICVSVNDEVVHGIPTENSRVLKEGDIVSLDFALSHKGLITDMAVTIPVGDISDELAKFLEITKSALQAGIKAAKGGKKIGDVSQAIERVGMSFGYGIVEDLAGHGVGYSVHEEPMVPNFGEAGTGPVLKPGMVLAIEPMFNMGSGEVVLQDDGYTYKTADGKVSAHFEHTVLITKGDAEILTKEN